jgi:protein-tyrosine-phosphatase/predicted ATP-grasp superfamily ATP-dependent carboligase
LTSFEAPKLLKLWNFETLKPSNFETLKPALGGTALVLDAHSRAGLEAAQALGRLGIAVDVAAHEPDCLAFHSRYRRLCFSSPSTGFAKWLRALEEEHPYSLIVPSTELSLIACMSLAEGDPLRAKTVLPQNSALEVALDKQRTCELAATLGIPVPRSRQISAEELANANGAGAAVPLPCVVKPIRSIAGNAFFCEAASRPSAASSLAPLPARIVRTPEERSAALRALLPFGAVVEQEYVCGHGVGMELLFAGGKEVWHFAHERIHEYPLTGGASTYRRSIVPDPRLLAASRRLLEALQWHGVAMVEFKMAPDGRYWLMEINPRLWGSLALAIDAGVNFPAGLFMVATGKLPAVGGQQLAVSPWLLANRQSPIAKSRRKAGDRQPTAAGGYRIGYYTRDLANDIQWQVANLRADHHDPLLFTRPRLRALLECLRPLAGRESWDHFDWRDLRPTWLTVQHVLCRYWGALRREFAQRRLRQQVLRRHRRLEKQLAIGDWQLAGQCPRGATPAFGGPLRRSGSMLRRESLANSQLPIANCRSLLFLCYGNICRSPFAEAVARQMLPAGWQMASAGFFEAPGRPSPENLYRAALRLGIDLAAARSQRVTPELVASADLILVMDLENYRRVAADFPQAISRTTLLGLFDSESGRSPAGRHSAVPGPHAAGSRAAVPAGNHSPSSAPRFEIADPYGASTEETDRILRQIKAAMQGLAARLAPREGPAEALAIVQGAS